MHTYNPTQPSDDLFPATFYLASNAMLAAAEAPGEPGGVPDDETDPDDDEEDDDESDDEDGDDDEFDDDDEDDEDEPGDEGDVEPA